jgi:hypothetical protein
MLFLIVPHSTREELPRLNNQVDDQSAKNNVAVYGDGEVASHLSAESPTSWTELLDRALPPIRNNAANSSI